MATIQIISIIFYSLVVVFYVGAWTWFKVDDFLIKRMDEKYGRKVMIIEYTADKSHVIMRFERRKDYKGIVVVWREIKIIREQTNEGIVK